MPVRQTLHWNAALNLDLKIPPNDPNFKAAQQACSKNMPGPGGGGLALGGGPGQ